MILESSSRSSGSAGHDTPKEHPLIRISQCLCNNRLSWPISTRLRHDTSTTTTDASTTRRPISITRSSPSTRLFALVTIVAARPPSSNRTPRSPGGCMHQLREHFGPRDALDCVIHRGRSVDSLWRRVLWAWWRLWWWLWGSDRATQRPWYQVKTTWSPCTLFRTRMMMWDGCECSGNQS
jgi:hypothetical protein